MTRLFVFLGLMAGLCAACIGTGERATVLSIVAINPDVGRATFQLRCDPAGGNLPDNARACTAVRAKPTLVSAPKPFNCLGDEYSHWLVTISGRVQGKPIYRRFGTCWTPQMETIRRLRLTWSVLRGHLAPRRHESLLPGEARQFPVGALRPADVVACDILGHHLQVGVPIERGPRARVSMGYSGLNVVSVNLTVERHVDGSVTATCAPG